MTPTLAIDTIEDGAGLESLAPEWSTLWAAIPAASPFQRPEWALAWWRHFRPGRLRAIAVREDGRLVGLAPLWHESGELGERLLPVGIGVGDILDILAEPQRRSPVLAAIADAIGRMPGWSAFDAPDCRPGSSLAALPAPVGSVPARAPGETTPALDLTGPADPDGLPLRIPAPWRRNLRRARRLAGEAGTMRIERREADPAGFLGVLEALHGSRWRERGEAGVLADPRVIAFQREALAGLAAAGLARLAVLAIDGRPAGAYYGLRTVGRAYAYIGGFDPAFAAVSPGTILLGDAIAAARAEGLEVFDFLRGAEAYKYRWGAVDAPALHLTWRRP
ncbi:GNAT family N-acetyltransferase [Prosthecomicrobium sp. N25]|uniref:GNAT family N-acetyltransferase n=1 Tax=Prosthecomicrobium sp. N25 TaxID=3129254 RepID=UPI0030782CB3